jgi:hypothetical protein
MVGRAMRYVLCAFGLIVAAVSVGQATPLAAWGWRWEVPVAPDRSAKSGQSAGEDEGKDHPLVGRWLKKDETRPRLIEFKETGQLIDSDAPLGGLKWTAMLFEKGAKGGALSVGELTLRADLGPELDAGSSERRVFLCTFDVSGAGAEKSSRGKSGKSRGKAKDKAKAKDKVKPTDESESVIATIGHVDGDSCNLTGEYERITAEAWEQPTKVANTWLDLESGRVLDFFSDEKVVPHNGADQYLNPGQWFKIVRKRAPRDFVFNPKERILGPLAGKEWKIKAVEQGVLAVRVGGLVTPGSRIVLCDYALGYMDVASAKALAGIFKKSFGQHVSVSGRTGEVDGDIDALVLTSCEANWTSDSEDRDLRQRDRQGSWIVRILGGEDLDPELMGDDQLLLEDGIYAIGVVLIGP